MRSVFVIFDEQTYDVASAVEVSVEAVRELARDVAYVNGAGIRTAANLTSLPGARDVTSKLQTALERLWRRTTRRLLVDR